MTTSIALALQEALKFAKDLSDKCHYDYKRGDKRGDSYTEGKSDAADEIAIKIAALATQPTVEHLPVGRDARQRQVHEWCVAAFGGDQAASIPQRGIRLLEEAAEAAQASGCAVEMARDLIDYVFSKEPGKLSQELGGVGITVLALAAAASLSADEEERRELARVLSKPLEHFTARNQQKNDAGFLTGDRPTVEAVEGKV